MTLPRPCNGAVNDAGIREQCGVPVKATRCPKHEAMYQKRRRPPASQRGYDRQYQKDRATLLESSPVCELRLPGCTHWATTADHPTPLAAGGSPRQQLVPACSHCNSSKGARIS